MYFMTKNHLFFTIHNTNRGFLVNFYVLITLPRVRSVDREPIVYNDNEPTRVQTCDDDRSLFPAKPASH